MPMYLISVTETHRYSYDCDILDKLEKELDHNTITKSSWTHKHTKEDDWYRVSLTKKFNDEKFSDEVEPTNIMPIVTISPILDEYSLDRDCCLISTVETYRVDTEDEVAKLLDKAKQDKNYTVTKCNYAYKHSKDDEWYRVVLSKQYAEEKNPLMYATIEYSLPKSISLCPPLPENHFIEENTTSGLLSESNFD